MAKTEKKLPLTPEMEEYARASEEAAKNKKIMEDLRPVVLEQCQQAGKQFEGLTWSKNRKYDIDPLNLYKWVEQEWPHLVRELTQNVIDPEKFAKAHDTKLISYEEIPEWVYSEDITYRLTPSRRKKN